MILTERFVEGSAVTGDKVDKEAQQKKLKLEGQVEHREHVATSLDQPPDAIDVRNADRATLRVAYEQNHDNWRSRDGHFAITDGDQILANQKKAENKSSDQKTRIDEISETGNQLAQEAKNNPALEPVALLRSYADKLPEGTEKQKLVKLTRQQGAELSPEIRARLEKSRQLASLAGLDEGGTHRALTLPIKQAIDAAQSDEPLSQFGKSQGISSRNEISKVGRAQTEEHPFEAFRRLTPEQREVLTKALQECPDIIQQRPDVAISTGIYKGAKNMTDGAVALGGMILATIEFTSDVLTNNPRALDTGARVGQDLGSAIASGIKIFQFAQQYVDNIKDTGDYQKPLRDLVEVKDQLDAKWNRMTEFERQQLLAECTTGFALGAIPTSRLIKAQKFTEALEELGQAASKLDSNGREAVAKAIRKMIDHIGPQIEVVDATTGKVIQMPAAKLEDFSLKMAKHKGDGDKPHISQKQAFRGDQDPWSPRHPKGWRKSHINLDGNLEPANPEGIYKGKKVNICHHLDGGWNAAFKGNSPYTSFSGTSDIERVIAKYGEYTITLELKELKKAIAAEEVKGVKVHELPDILKAIDENTDYKETAKRKHRAWAKRDNEVLVEGTIPRRFFKVEK